MAGEADGKGSLERGYTYLIVADSPSPTFRQIEGLLAGGSSGLVLSTAFPEKLRKEFSLPGAEVWWLTDSLKSGEKVLDPKRLDFEVMRTLKHFTQAHPGGTVLLHGVEFLIVQNGPEKVFTFLKQAGDVCAPGGMTFLVPVAQGAVAPEVLGQLERQFDRVERGLGEAQPQAVRTAEVLAEAPRTKRFVGRQAELDLLTREGEGPRVFVLQGMAGIGKSSLAARACELLRGRRPLFWHRVRAWDSSQSVLSSLGSFLAAVGRPGLRAILARGEADRVSEVLREDLPGTHAFLVFDDAHEGGKEVLGLLGILKDAAAGAQDLRVVVLTRKAVHFYDRRDVVLSKVVSEMELGGLKPEEVETFLADGHEAHLAEMASRLGGHPLFLELVRATAHPVLDAETLDDVRHFIEEEIYAELSEPERHMMKLASLYRVPVPREALFLHASTSHDTLAGLLKRSLVRREGERAFGLHDSIRAFFDGILAPQERAGLGKFASGQLDRMATEAGAGGNWAASLDCLSNALAVAASDAERVPLLERVGDANLRIGALATAEAAFREAVRLGAEREAAARTHRKLADAFLNRGELATVAKECDVGFQALGDADSVERGWLHLILGTSLLHASVHSSADRRDNYLQMKEHADHAHRIFTTSGDLSGQARSLNLRAILVEEYESDLPAAGVILQDALAMAEASKNPATQWDVLSTLLSYHSRTQAAAEKGADARALHYLGKIEALVEETNDLDIRCSMLQLRGWLFVLRGRFDEARVDLTEEVRIATAVHAPLWTAAAKAGLALIQRYQGDYEGARKSFDEVAAWYLACDQPRPAARTQLSAAWCSLLMGDVEGYRARMVLFEGDKFAPFLEEIDRGLDNAVTRLIAGEREGVLESFPKPTRAEEETFWEYHVSALCRALGDDRGAEEHLSRARASAFQWGYHAWAAVMDSDGRRFADAVTRAGRPGAARDGDSRE